jgi:hypothetical protein
MLGKLYLSLAVLMLGSCVAMPVNPVTTALSAYRPIELNAEMRAGVSATRSFELIYALEYATNRTDKTIPEVFGGLSSLLFSKKEGSSLRFEFISDQGQFGSFQVPDAMDNSTPLAPRLSGSAMVAMLPLRSADGVAFSGANNVDAEGLAAMPGGHLISLERNHRIVRLSGDNSASGRGNTSKGPALTGFDGLEPNGGMEALVALPDGRFLASAEYGRADQGPETKLKAPYWIFGLNQTGPIAPVGTFQNSGLYGVTEARVMDSDLWLLKREYDPSTKMTKVRLERCPLAGVLAGTPVCTLELALAPPFVMDNYEGLEIFKQAGTGDLYFYMLSDDNFSADQRTIMLAFKLGR